LVLYLSVICLFIIQSVQGYNYDSHDKLTKKAVTYSQLEQYLPTIGFKSTKDILAFHIPSMSFMPPCTKEIGNIS